MMIQQCRLPEQCKYEKEIKRCNTNFGREVMGMWKQFMIVKPMQVSTQNKPWGNLATHSEIPMQQKSYFFFGGVREEELMQQLGA